MKKLIEFFAEQKLFGDLLTFAIIGLGIYSFLTIRREVFHNVSFDVITVITTFPGASASEIETLITNPLEQDFNELDGVKKMLSTSIEGRSLIIIQLDSAATNEEKAKSDVRDIVDRFSPELPEGAERPIITSVESKQQPLIDISVAGDMPEGELRSAAKKLEREIETIPGVAAVKTYGLREPEIHVEAKPQFLEKFHVTLDDMVTALKRTNLSISGGVIEAMPSSENKERIIKTSGQFVTPADVEKTVVRANEMGQAIRIRDVAAVTAALERPSVLNRTNGTPSIRLGVLKKEKTDAISLVDGLFTRLETLKSGLDPRIQLDFINDNSQFIRRRLGVLFGNFTIGLSMVLLFLPLLLPLRFAILIAIGEPFAFLGTLLAFQSADIALNLISVMGLILVSGILVDDGIVVVDNVARLIKQGMSPKKAAILGAQQMWRPVIASASTTIMAFIPLAMMSGIFGKFVRYIPLGIIVPICISLFENFFIMPHHIGSWLRPSDFDRNRKGWLTRMQNASDSLWSTWLMPRYLKVLNTLLKWRYAVAFGTLVLVGVSVLLATKVMKVVLFPPDGVEIFIIRAETVTGTSLAGTEQKMIPIEKALSELSKTELEDFVTMVGIQQQDPNDPETRRGMEYAQLIVYLTPETNRHRTAIQIIEDLRQKVGKPEGIERISFQRVRTGPPVGLPLAIGVRGNSLNEILAGVTTIKEELSKVKGVSDIADSYIVGKEQVAIDINDAEAAAAGLSVASIGTTVRAAYEGIVATSIRKLDEEIKVRVLLAKENRAQESSLEHLKVGNPSGFHIPLTSVASLRKTREVALYQHENNQREVRVIGEVDTKVVSAAQANDQMKKLVPEFQKKHPTLSFYFGGEDVDTQESLASLRRAFVFAVVGIFLILLLTFRTLLQPLVVLITIPLGLISVVLTFFVHGMPISFLGMIGMIGLSGIIVNNAIVFVDFVNEARKEGKDRWQSLIQAAEYRALPIFLTTVTTVIGILPTAYGLGGTDKFVVPIAMAMGWGLMIGSVLTLFLLPATLAILDDASLLGARVLGRRKKASLPAEN